MHTKKQADSIDAFSHNMHGNDEITEPMVSRRKLQVADFDNQEDLTSL
jgi:hypothetical protein